MMVHKYLRQMDPHSSLLSATVLTATLTAAGSALAADDDNDKGWFIPKNTPFKNVYIGAGVDIARNDYPGSNQDGSVSNASEDESGVGSGLFVGYQINDNLAIQGGHRDLGEADFRGTSSGGPSWDAGPVRAKHEADGWELGVMGRWPISARWYALGFVGMFWWESKETFYESTGRSTVTESGSDATYALGFEFDHGLRDRIVYRFMGSHHSVGDDDYDVDSVSATVIYRFP